MTVGAKSAARNAARIVRRSSRHGWRRRPRPRCTDSTMKPVTPCSITSGTEPQFQQSPACRTPSPRSSPGRTARASRSGTAAPAHRRGTAASVSSPISPMNSTQRMPSSSGSIIVFEIRAVDCIDLRRDPQRHAGALRAMAMARSGTLFRRNAAEKGQVAAGGVRLNSATGRRQARGGRCATQLTMRQGPALMRPRSRPAGTAASVGRPRGRSFRSRRPCSVVTVLPAQSSKNGKCSRSTWKCSMSNSCARRRTSCSMRQMRRQVGFERCRVEPDRLVAHRRQRRARARVGRWRTASRRALRPPAHRSGARPPARCRHRAGAGQLHTAERSARFARE